MKILTGILGIGLLLSTANAATINEIRTDQPGSDVEEYFELAGTPGESLDGLTYLVIGDDGGDGSGNPGSRSGSVEAVVDLTGLTIPADGYFLAAEATFNDPDGLGLSGSVDLTASLNFQNSDNVSHLLVAGFSGALNDLLDTNRDGILDIMPWASTVDGISLIETPNPPTVETDEWDYGFGGGIGPDGSKSANSSNAENTHRGRIHHLPRDQSNARLYSASLA